MTETEASYANAIIASAGIVAPQVGARAVMVYEEAAPDLAHLTEVIEPPIELILIRRDGQESGVKDAKRIHHLEVPAFNLTRMDQIKMATVLAFSQRMLDGGDTFVALTGVAGKPLDSMVVMRVGEEYELFQSVDQPKLTEHVRRVVFQRVLTIALELANEGREGKPVGALFVIGNVRELQKHTEQHIMNPFRGYTWKYGFANMFVLDEAGKIVRWGHTGEEDGVSCRLYYYPERGLDVTILANQSWCAGSLGWEVHDLILAMSP